MRFVQEQWFTFPSFRLHLLSKSTIHLDLDQPPFQEFDILFETRLAPNMRPGNLVCWQWIRPEHKFLTCWKIYMKINLHLTFRDPRNWIKLEKEATNRGKDINISCLLSLFPYTGGKIHYEVKYLVKKCEYLMSHRIPPCLPPSTHTWRLSSCRTNTFHNPENENCASQIFSFLKIFQLWWIILKIQFILSQPCMVGPAFNPFQWLGHSLRGYKCFKIKQAFQTTLKLSKFTSVTNLGKPKSTWMR